MKRNLSFPILAALIFLALGMALRLWYYFDARSLFIDEANLALNISELSYAGFFQPLRYQQYAPPFFLAATKFTVQWMGNHEWALRLWPLAGSLALLPLVHALGQRLALAPAVRWFPMAMLALSPFLLRYGTEVKQYSTDAAIALGVALMALSLPAEGLRSRHYWLWALVGGLSLWFSMPAVFVLCGAGAYYLYGFVQQKGWAGLRFFGIVGAFWAFSFLLLYFAVLQAGLSRPELLDYHAPYFFPTSLLAPEAWRQLGRIFYGLLSPVLGYTVVGLISGIALLLYGCCCLARQRPGVFLLLAVPILACFAAAALHRFSLIPRVALFLMPFLLVLASYGASEAWKKSGRYARLALLALLILEASPFFDSVQHLGKPMDVENLKGVLQQARAEGKAGPAYIDFEAAPAYRYYSERHFRKEDYALPDAVLLNWDTDLGPLLNQQAGAPGFWLLFSHLVSEEPREKMTRMREVAEKVAEEKLRIEKTGAGGYWYGY